MSTRAHLVSAIVVPVTLALAAPSAFPANRLHVQPDDLVIEKTGQAVVVLGDNDFNAYGFSMALKFEPAKLRVTAVALGASAAAAAWSNIADLNSTAGLTRINSTGEIMAGAVLDFDPKGTVDDLYIPAGTGRSLLVISVDVLAAAPATTLIDFTEASFAVPTERIHGLASLHQKLLAHHAPQPAVGWQIITQPACDFPGPIIAVHSVSVIQSDVNFHCQTHFTESMW